MRNQVLRVLPVAHHGRVAPEHAFLMMHKSTCKNVLHVNQKCTRQNDRAELVHEENSAEAADETRQPSRPDALAEAQRQAGCSEPQKCGEENGVQIALCAREALDIASAGDLLLLNLLRDF